MKLKWILKTFKEKEERGWNNADAGGGGQRG